MWKVNCGDAAAACCCHITTIDARSSECQMCRSSMIAIGWGQGLASNVQCSYLAMLHFFPKLNNCGQGHNSLLWNNINLYLLRFEFLVLLCITVLTVRQMLCRWTQMWVPTTPKHCTFLCQKSGSVSVSCVFHHARHCQRKRNTFVRYLRISSHHCIT